MAAPSDPILARILRQAGRGGDEGASDLLALLARELLPSDLTSLLLRALHERAAARSPADILAHYQRAAAVRPSTADPRRLNALEAAAFAAAAAFEPLEVAPVQPLASVSGLAGLDQDLVLGALRGLEVLADPTNAFALEAAARRRAGPRKGARPVRLCGGARVLRLQPFDGPGLSPHFRLFALATAGRDLGAWRFEHEALREHVAVQLELYSALPPPFLVAAPRVELADLEVTAHLLAAHGLSLDDLRGEVGSGKPGAGARFLAARGVVLPAGLAAAAALDEPPHAAALAAVPGWPRLRERLDQLEAQVVRPLAVRFPQVRFTFELGRLEALGYYRPFAFRITGETAAGERFGLGDGGLTDWTQRLLGDRKERLLISGLGTELLAKVFAAA